MPPTTASASASHDPAEASTGTIVIGPAPLWRVLTWLVFGGFVAFAALLVWGATTKPPSGQTVAPSGIVAAVVLVAAGAGVRSLMARRAPRARFSPEGLSGAGLPLEIEWADIRDARVYRVQIRWITHTYVEPVLDAAADDRYLAKLPAISQLGWKSNRLKGLPVFGLVVTYLDRSPDEIAGLVREYAARYGGASDGAA